MTEGGQICGLEFADRAGWWAHARFCTWRHARAPRPEQHPHCHHCVRVVPQPVRYASHSAAA
eukprot:5183390-Pyramimonas_sp.AAC.1